MGDVRARTAKVWSLRGGEALSVIVCYMNQKLTGSRCIVVSDVIPEVENIHARNHSLSLPTKAEFDWSLPCVEQEAPLWFYFFFCLLRSSGPRQRFQPIRAAQGRSS